MVSFGKVWSHNTVVYVDTGIYALVTSMKMTNLDLIYVVLAPI